MTIDDLVKIYNDAAAQGDQRAGLSAVVKAIQRETRFMTLNRESLDAMFSQIIVMTER